MLSRRVSKYPDNRLKPLCENFRICAERSGFFNFPDSPIIHDIYHTASYFLSNYYAGRAKLSNKSMKVFSITVTPPLPQHARKERRGSLEIISDILKVCESEASKTSLVYKCNLNFKLISRYLQILTDSGLIYQVQNDGIVLYKCTEKGLDVSSALSHAKEALATPSRVLFEHPTIVA